MWTVERLRQFEESIREAYLTGKIRGALHLSRGNESQLIEIFKDIRPGDWVFSTWRSHYHALLHGVPEDMVRANILAGHSISLNFPEHRFFTSSIVGGCLPIAVGTALAIKRLDNLVLLSASEIGVDKSWVKTNVRHVWCFVGDMAASCGMFHECQRYSYFQELPITFVVENNGYSTNTPTSKAWDIWNRKFIFDGPHIISYKYERKYPHSGYKL